MLELIKLNVPFFPQTSPLNCGPTALRMVLAYFGNDPGIEMLEQKTGILDGKGITTIQIATAAGQMGYKTEFYSKHILFNEEHLKLDYYKKYNAMDVEQSKRWVADAEAAGVNIEEKTMDLDTLLSYLSKDSLLIMLLDWNVVHGKPEKGYNGHFVPVVGYDKDHIYVHDHGLNNPTSFLAIQRDVFDAARKATGTDEDLVVIHRNR